MLPCPSCGRHLRRSEAACFACGAPLTTVRNATAAALLLGLVACVGATGTSKDSDTDTGTVPQAEYGATVTDTVTTTTPQPEYGVTLTDTSEPDHSGAEHSAVDVFHTGHSGHSGR